MSVTTIDEYRNQEEIICLDLVNDFNILFSKALNLGSGIPTIF